MLCSHFPSLVAKGLTPNAAAAVALKLHYGKGNATAFMHMSSFYFVGFSCSPKNLLHTCW